MKDDDKSKEQLVVDIAALRQRIVNLEKLGDHHNKLEKELVTCAERYQILFDNANDALFVHSISGKEVLGKFVEVNKTACNMLGYDRDDLLKKTPLDIHDPESLGDAKMCVRKLLDSRHEIFEGTFLSKSGKTIPVELSCHIFEMGKETMVLSVARDISERKRIEELQKNAHEELERKVEERSIELQRSEGRYKAIYERSLLCVYLHDFEGQFIDANDAALELLGYSRTEMPKLNIATLLDEKQMATVHQAMEELKQQGHQKSPVEFKLRRKDGGFVWVETEGVLLCKDDKPYAIQGIARDITKRKQFEEQWKKTEADKAMILESIMEHVIYHDLSHTIVWANNAAARSLNMMAEQLVGQHCYVLWQHRSSPCPACPVQVALKTGKSQVAEMTTPDGRIWLIRGYPVRDESGTIIGAVEVTFDITVIRQADEAIRASEDKYRALTENINVGIYRNTAGPKGRFIEANAAIVRMFGYASKDEFLEIDVSDLYKNPCDRETFTKKMFKCGFVREEELYLKRKDGSTFYGSVSAVSIKDDRGDLLYFDGIIYDITERKKAEEDLQESYLKLKRVLNGTVNALASTTEKRDPYTAGHQHRVAQLACAIAREMGLSDEEIEGIRVAAIVHDIGKIYVAAEILNKPVKLKDIEMALIKAHCQAGYDILKTVDFPWPIAKMVLQHHEKLDGSGYPQGLQDDEIILGAKILAVADVVEAMISHRPYRSALSIEEALTEVRENKGTLYAAAVVDACERIFVERFTFK